MIATIRDHPIRHAWMAMTRQPSADLIDLLLHTHRHRLFGGKSARMLHLGDEVALSDLQPTRDTSAYCMAVVAQCFLLGDGSVLVKTLEHGLFTVPGARLVLVRRETLDLS